MVKKIKHLLFLLFISFVAHAADEIRSVRLTGANLFSPSNLIEVSDDKFDKLTGLQSGFTVLNSSVKVEFGINEDLHVLKNNFKSEVTFDVILIDGSLNVTTLTSQKLKINYSQTGKYTDKSQIIWNGYYYAKITNIKVVSTDLGTPSSILSNSPDLYLDASVSTNKIYDFTRGLTSVTSQNWKSPIINNELEIYWDYVTGAEEYELQWTYVNNYSTILGIGLPANQIIYDLEHDATSIHTTNTYYKIPLIYENGYIVYRIRPIGKNNTGDRVDGKWSNILPSDLVSGASSVFVVPVSAFQSNLNWTSTFTFDEHGKSGIGINYSDGLLFSRQSLARLNSEESVIAQTTLYDYFGRPTISMLPAPVSGKELAYRKDLNRVINGSSTKLFEKSTFANYSAYCSTSNYKLDRFSSKGAANYYSSENPDKDGLNGYIPDAGEIPYSQVSYMPEPSGRIKAQSLPGVSHNFGSGKETEYLYSNPTQVELDRLFGSEAGKAFLYEKNYTKDANGQVSTAYIDGYGRTVATALVGENPANLDPLPNKATVEQLTDNLTNNNRYDANNYCVTVSTKIYVSGSNQQEEYIYETTFDKFIPTECQDICLDCQYNLDLSITDDCGVEFFDDDSDPQTPPKAFSGSIGATEPYASNCVVPNTPAGLNLYSPLTITFSHPGIYTINKKICVSEKPINDYVKIFLEDPNCNKSFCHFYDSIIATKNFKACNPTCSDCDLYIRYYNSQSSGVNPDNPVYYPPLTKEEIDAIRKECQNTLCAAPATKCGYYKALILTDFMPGGFFHALSSSPVYPTGSASPSTPVPLWANSILNPANTLKYGNSTAHYDWQHLPPGVVYKDADGTPSVVSIGGIGYLPTQLSSSQFSYYWRDSWAEAFVMLHPEYCKQEFYCNEIGSYLTYDEQLRQIDEYTDACTFGYVNPLPSQTFAFGPATICNNPLGADPLFTSPPSAFTSALQAQFIAELQNYNSSGNSIYYYITDHLNLFTNSPAPTVFGSDLCTRDLEWEKFKALYLALKDKYYKLMYNSFVPTVNCYNVSGYTSSPPADSEIDNLFSNNNNGGLAPGNTNSSTAAAAAATQCASTCHDYRQSWKDELLHSCLRYTLLSSALQDEILDNFEEVCKLGCTTQDQPLGSSTLPVSSPGWTIPGSSPAHIVHSFQEVLDHFLPATSLLNTCSVAGITSPGPYVGSNILTDCGCDKILKTDYDFTNGPSIAGVTKARDLFYKRYGFDLKNFNMLKCACQKATNNMWVPGYVWTSTDLNVLQLNHIVMPENFVCEACVPCDQIAATLGSLYSSHYSYSYSSVGDFINDESKDDVIVGAFDGKYSYSDILNMYYDCGSTNKSLLTQEATDLTAFLKSLVDQKFLDINHAMKICTDSKYYLSTLYNGTLPVPTNYQYEFTYTSSSITIYIKNGATIINSITINKPVSAPSLSVNDWKQVISHITDFAAVMPVGATAGMAVNDFQFSVSNYGGYFTGTCSWPLAYLANSILSPGSVAFAICPPKKFSNQCNIDIINDALSQAKYLYNTYLTSLANQFIVNYKKSCYSSLHETFTRKYKIQEYQYTLYYYDQSGNLQRTVPPKGVSVLNITSMLPATPLTYPAHSAINAVNTNYVTDYKYNSYNQPLQSNSVDGGTTIFYYDKLGRIMASENANQSKLHKYSYSLYDKYGRITEVGEMDISPVYGALTDVIATEESDFVNYVSSTTRKQVISTYYDGAVTPNTTIANNQFNLRNRVSTVTFEEVYNGTIAADYATHYSYDEHGNVTTVYQENDKLKTALPNQVIKTIEYNYDLISGNVNRIAYQKNQADQLYHKYDYDSDNRLKEVFTSRDNQNWEKDAKYFYYKHGALARVEKGDLQVEGTDYYYNILGWIKGVNSNNLKNTSDPGKDANRVSAYNALSAGIHAYLAKDAASYSLNYFDGDYSPIKAFTSISAPGYSDINPIASVGNIATGGAFNLTTDAPQLYNGNISSMVTTLTNLGQNNTPLSQEALPQLTAYKYDQLQRLKDMKAYTGINLNTNNWDVSTTSNTDDSYKMHLQYDPNGNILELFRNGASPLIKTGSSMDMDDLKYNYIAIPGGTPPPILPPVLTKNSNQLFIVTDSKASTVDFTDIDDQTGAPNGTGSNQLNYTYDDIGNLISDASEHIAHIEWTIDKKVKRIIRDGGFRMTSLTSRFYPSDLEYEYNANRQRIVKIEKPRNQTTGQLLSQLGWKYTYYVYDANGQVMATYNRAFSSLPPTIIYNDKMSLNESHLYGSSRLGVATRDEVMEYNSFVANFSSVDNPYYVNGLSVSNINSVFATTLYDVATSTPFVPNNTSRVLGDKQYEFTNHLGNVITTISDRKIPETATTTGLFNDFELPFNNRDASQKYNGQYSCLLSSNFSPTMRTQVYAGDIVNANIRSYYLNAVPTCCGSSGMLVLAFLDASGNFLYTAPASPTSPGTEYWFSNGVNTTPTGSWQSLSINKTIPNVFYTDPTGASVYTGAVYAVSHAWNPNANPCWFDDHALNITHTQPIVAGYKPEVINTTDYYAFGQSMPGRSYSNGTSYRYGMNGQEKDDEIATGIYGAEYWEYDSRLGRRWNIDPVVKPWESPYACFNDNPVLYSDPKGLDGEDRAKSYQKKNGGTLNKGSNGKWYVDQGYSSKNADGTYEVGVSSKEFGDRWYERAGKSVGNFFRKAADVIKNGDFTADVTGKISLGIQAKVQAGLGKYLGAELNLNLAKVDLLKSDLHLSKPNKGDWSYNSDWNYVGEDGKVHVSQDAKLGIDVAQYPLLEGFYKNEFDLDGLNAVDGSSKSNYGVSVVVPLIKKKTASDVEMNTVKDAAKAMGYTKNTSVKSPKSIQGEKDFYGLDIGAGAALFLGVDLNIKIGFKY